MDTERESIKVKTWVVSPRNKDSIAIKYWRGLEEAFKSLYMASFMHVFIILWYLLVLKIETYLLCADLRWTKWNYSDVSFHGCLISLPLARPLFCLFFFLSLLPFPFFCMCGVQQRSDFFLFIENQFSRHGLLIHPFLQWYNMPPLSYTESIYIHGCFWELCSVLLEYLFTAVPYLFYYHEFIICLSFK